MSELLDRRDVLDHGYIGVVEHWGSDERIVEAARMSTNKGFEGWGGGSCKACVKANAIGWHDGLYISRVHQQSRKDCTTCEGTGKDPGDKKLLRRLYTKKHATPFEMAGMIIEVQAPIFVFREWHRHRTQSYNEMSARYTPLPDMNYIPTIDRCIVVAGTNRQANATGNRVPTHDEVLAWLDALGHVYAYAERVYQDGLTIGIPKEIARLPGVCADLPVGRYSRMRASTNLRNWLAFLTLRMAPDAQLEIRLFANIVGEYIAQRYPRTWELFVQGQRAAGA